MSPRRIVLTAALGLVSMVAPSARAQVAFQPVVGAFPNGVTMSTTPVVSADRRYVRIGVNPQFSALEGLDAFSVPAAVSGGPGGPGALRSVSVGATFNAGMNGVGGEPENYGDNPGYNPAFFPSASPDA